MTANFKDNVHNLVGAGYTRDLIFDVPALRNSEDDDAIIVPTSHGGNARVVITPDADGEFTTPAMDAGPARVTIGGKSYDFTVPDTGTDLRLFPRLLAGMAPAGTAVPQAVVNGGGVAVAKWVTAAQWSDIAPGDPDTTYFVKPS